MKSSNRVLINTIAQYVRTIINMLLSLYTVRLVLQCLGHEDYGIYTLVAGVVAMLAFITNSLQNTTQRFISYYQGKNSIDKIRTVFNNSLVMHWLLGLGLLLVLYSISPLIFNGFLDIPSERLSSARITYYIVVIMLVLTFITAPYRSLLISHENIVYLSIIDVLDGILKVVLVTIMTFLDYDYLIVYSIIMLSIELFNLIALAGYSHFHYSECVLIPSIKKVNRNLTKEIVSFAGWNVYGTACLIVQRQGFAVLINRVSGTVLNAAYGIGYQLAGYSGFLSGAIINAIQPQIMKSEGGGDRDRAFRLSNITSKMVFSLMSMISIPLIFEVDAILKLWLGTPPEHSSTFCIIFIIAMLADSLTIGLTYINSAIGKIGLYSFVMSTPKLLSLPIAILVNMLTGSVFVAFCTNAVVEFIMAMVRIPLIRRQVEFSLKKFAYEVLLREFISVALFALMCYIIVCTLHFEYRFIVTFIVANLFYLFFLYFIGFNKSERAIFRNIVESIINAIKGYVCNRESKNI